MKFLILVQGLYKNAKKFEIYKEIDTDVVYLSYDMEGFDSNFYYLYYPSSSWAEGRNKLIDFAKQIGRYDYYIFMDDDAVFQGDGWIKFKNNLERYSPQVALPLSDSIERKRNYDLTCNKQRPTSLDQIVQAYNSFSFYNSKSLPYVTKFDHLSWWYSCLINEFLILSDDIAWQFNDVLVINSEHVWEKSMDRSALNYKGGTSEYGISLVKNYINNNYGKQCYLYNSIYWPKYLPHFNYKHSFSSIKKRGGSLTIIYMILHAYHLVLKFIFPNIFRHLHESFHAR
jgi:hypothetical protein